MPHVLRNPRSELAHNAAAAAANVVTDGDLLKLILDNHGLYASRFARVCKQWQRAAAAVKLSGQTLETEPHVSCGGYSWIAGGYDDEDEDYDAAMGPCASTISALPDNKLLVADTNNGRILMLTPDGERLYELFVPGEYPCTVGACREVLYFTHPPGLSSRQDVSPNTVCRRFRLSDGEDLPHLQLPERYHDCSKLREFHFAVAPDDNRLFALRFLLSHSEPDPGCIDVYDLETLELSFSFGAFPPTDPMCLAFGSSRPSLFVASLNSGRISVFDKTGAFLRVFGSAGRAPGSFTKLQGIAVAGDRLFTAEHRGVDFVGRVQVLTLEGVPLQVLPVHTCGGPLSICASAQFVHVLCKVDEEREELLHIRDYDSDGEELLFEEEQEDFGHPMHSLVGFRIRA